ncbi:polycystin-1-like protein 2 [Saccostrea echinata]|uniref:polycystin-1-like protein 2 n=1 Tax=Saccostrea echinata TaxID=191078 RepID=UPI002A7F6A90|nr:polycystin-1-like protein 2 [Saccostrea echinata]
MSGYEKCINVNHLLRSILRIFLDVSHCFVLRVKHTELPLRNHDVSTLNEIVNHFIRILNNLIEVLIPKQWIDFDEELSFLSILSELVHIFGTSNDKNLILQEKTDGISERLREKAELLFELRTHEKKIATIQREIMSEYFQRIQDTIMDVQLLTLETIVTGEKLEFQKPLIKLIIDKTTYGDFRDTYINDNMKNSNILGLVNLNNTVDNPNTLLNVMVIVYKRNPFIFGGNSSSLTSDIFVFHFGNNMDNDYLQLELNLENKVNNTNNSSLRLFQRQPANDLIFYKFTVSNDDDVTIIFLKPQNFTVDLSTLSLFEIYISDKPYPSNSSMKDNDFQASTSVRNWDEDYGFKVFVPSGVCLKGDCYLGIKPLGVAELVQDLERNHEHNETMSPNFQLLLITTTCRSWDRAKEAWISDDCTVLEMSTINNTVCRCPGNTFSTTFVVPPNTINFLTVWGKFDPKNGAVYGSLIVLVVFYVAALLVLKREDKKDMNRAFTTGSVRTFLFGTKSTLGTLQYLRIWHDNSGKGGLQDWFLSNIEIIDLQTNEKYIFLCDKWLSLYKDDCLIDRIIVVSTVEVAKSFQFLFPKNLQINITEHHMWLSLVYRPRKTKFTRVQRLSCLLALLHLNMISNAMFYKSPSEDTSNNYVQFGGFQFSPSVLYVSLMSIIITTLPVLLLSMLFRKRKIKKCLRTDSEENKNWSGIPSKFIKEKEDGLPCCVVYVAWIFLALTVLISAFFLLLYSMEWGKEKSEEWLLSFFLSFFESIVLVDPVKVLLMAVLFATLFKTAMSEESSDISLQKLKKYSNKRILPNKYEFAVFASKILSKQEPLGEEEIIKIKEQHEQEKRVKKAVKSLVLNAVFLLAIYTISFVERDPNSYSYKNNVGNYLHTADLSSIRHIPDFVSWINNTFIPILYPEKDYTDNELDVLEKQWFADRASIRVGPAQLRQLRMKPDACPVMTIAPTYPCYKYYSIAKADTSQYCIGWDNLNPSCAEKTESDRYFTKTSWIYTSAEDIWGIPYTGEYNTYDGGGYLIKFTKDRYQARMMLNEISNFNWIDRGTRAVFVEFTLYNPNSNMFITSKYLTEFLETGGIFSTIESQAFRPVAFVSSSESGIIFFYLVFIAYLIYLFVKILNKLRQRGCFKFIKVPWNCVTLAILILGVISICLYIVRVIYAQKAMQLFHDDKLTDANQFINFNHIIIWDNVLNVVFSQVIFLSTIKLLKVLGYNRRLTQVISVISNAGYDILGFSIIFILAFFGFVILGTLLLGGELEDFKSFLYTSGTLSNSFIGKNKLSSMIKVAPVLAQVFYFVYSVCVIMTLVTICAAILNSSISDVKSTVQMETDKFGISHMIRKLVYDLFGAKLKGNKNRMELYRPGNLNEFIRNGDFSTPNVVKLIRGSFYEVDDKCNSLSKEKYRQTGDDVLGSKLDCATEDVKTAMTPRDQEKFVTDVSDKFCSIQLKFI